MSSSAASSSSISVCGNFTAQKSKVSKRKKTTLNCQIISFNVKIVVLLNVSQLLLIQNHGGSGSSFPHDVEATLLLCLDGHGSGHTFLQFQKQEVIHLQNVREKNVGILFFPSQLPMSGSLSLKCRNYSFFCHRPPLCRTYPIVRRRHDTV